ncbi:MAG: hypothetical protein NC412_08135 [Roseburia sp.]|nr:hypothetical protein [Roseburia sp.]MCM1278665.1 hypothetical protein [Robinsoniella sp.]
MLKEEKEQWAKLKDRPPKEKLNYFWYYYKFYVIGAMVGIICLIIFIRGYRESTKEPSIYVALINSGYMTTAETSLMDDYVASRNIDTNASPARFDISISMTQGTVDDASVANSQKLMALFQTHAMDVIISDAWVLEEYAPLSAFANLETLLPEDLYEKVQDKLYFYTLSDGSRIPIGFYGNELQKLMKDPGYSKDNPPIVAISGTTDRPESAVDFIRYLLEE